MRPTTALVLALAFTAALAASPTHACRCAQRTLDAYFEEAEIVVIGRVRSVEPGRTPQGVGFIAVSPYLGLPVNQIVPRLLELSARAPGAAATPGC